MVIDDAMCSVVKFSSSIWRRLNFATTLYELYVMSAYINCAHIIFYYILTLLFTLMYLIRI
jgi:hypothetical protein